MIAPIPNQPALLIKQEEQRTLTITDLHIGWEMALTQKGIHVPTQTPRLLKKLTNLITTYRPDKLLILGDVKHTIASAEVSEWHDVPDFFSELKRLTPDISIIRGNHDGILEPLLPENIRMLPSTGIGMGEVGFFHGHRWPSPALLECRTLVMGHVHPVVALRDPAGFRITRQTWVKADCNAAQLHENFMKKHGKKASEKSERTQNAKPKASRLFIMPSFNDFLGGRPLNERRPSGGSQAERIVGPVLRSEAVDMENAEMYLLDRTYLGTLSQLRMLG